VLQKNTEIKAEKWQRKKVILRWHKDRKEIRAYQLIDCMMFPTRPSKFVSLPLIQAVCQVALETPQQL